MINCSDIHLSRKEIKVLKKYKQLGKSYELPYSKRIISLKFIESDFVCQIPGNMPTANGIFTLTEQGENYIQYCKEKLFLNKLPVYISLVALVSSFRTECLLLVRQAVLLLKKIAGI
jgi:hypothetical protein